MISAFIQRLSEDELRNWGWWLTLLTIVIPTLAALIAAFTGYAAMKVNDRVTELTDKRNATSDRPGEAIATKRMLSPDMRSRLVANLKPHAGTFIRIDALFGDGEAYNFALDLENAFKEAGWDTAAAQAMWNKQPPPGLIVLAPNTRVPVKAIVVQDALREAGLHAPADIDPALPEDGVRIVVGTKP